jgi:hypothetical protein
VADGLFEFTVTSPYMAIDNSLEPPCRSSSMRAIQKGEWWALTDFLNQLHVDHLVLAMAHCSAADLDALRDIDPRIHLSIGVVDVKVNHVETPA